MKRLMTLMALMLIGASLLGQNTFKYELRANGGLRVGGNAKIKIDSISATGGIYKLYNGATELLPNAAGGSMVYPSAGIPLSTGSGWGTSITNNSTNWNTAYSWGNHASAGYAPSASPTFTGGVTMTSSTTLPDNSTINIGTDGYISHTLADNKITVGGVFVDIISELTAGGLTLGAGNLSLTGSVGATGARSTKGWFTNLEVTNIPTISGNTLKSALSLTKSDVGLGNVTNESKSTMFSSPTFTGTVSGITASMTGAEAALGNPSTNGYVLSSTTSGTRSWVANGSGGTMVYPGAGIAVSTGSAWGTSITDASTNWNTAYTDRLKWDGGATGLTAATGRTSLGATTVGGNLFTLTNPSAIRFIRLNADNTVSTLSDTDTRTALAAAPVSLTINAQTGTSYTGVLSDAYKIVTMSNASANTFTIPLNSSVAYPIGTQITIVQLGAGETTIAATSGVTLNSADNKKDLRVQYSSCTIIKMATDTWLLIGDIEL